MKHHSATAQTRAPKSAHRPPGSREEAASAVPATGHDGHGERVRLAAYYLYETRGREDGHDLEDWLRAEALIEGEFAEASPDRAGSAH